MHAMMDTKPIGKCRGCPMNLKKRCAVFSHPHEQWNHGHKHCKGYMNQELYRRYLEEHMKEPPEKSHKEIRKEKMVELKTVEHQDGILNPGGSRW